MTQDLDEKLVKSFPLLYSDRNGDMRNTLMCWGFACGDGWFDIIWDFSSKIEPILRNFIKENPDLSCSHCGCKKKKHYGSKTPNPGKCQAIHVDPFSEEEPPGNYYACHCESYKSSHPRAVQVKEKFGGLRFYMSSTNDEIRDLVSNVEALSFKTCEDCGSPGTLRQTGWYRTLCDSCEEKTKKRKGKG